MVDPLSLAGIGWGMSAASWLISPVLSRFLNKCFDALGLDPRFQSRKKALDEKLERLQTTLHPQLIILTDAAQKSPYWRELEGWLQKLKSAYYEAEHLLGLVEYKRLEKEVNSLFPSTSKFNFKWNGLQLKLRKRNLLKSVENLEKIVNEAMKFSTILNLSTNSVNNSNGEPSESAQSRETISTPIFTVIGRDRDRDHIVKLLREDFPESSINAKCYSVIGIWGMGGSGKTTLAQFICEYEKEAKYFDLVVWAYVSQNFNLHSIFRRIWESAFKEDCPNCISIEGLNSKLQEKLRGKRFFLVLDDVWCGKDVSELELEQLFAPLQTGKRGSKILVTTRLEGAAKALGAINPIQLRELDRDEFLDLFMSHALHNQKDAEKHLEGSLKQIGEQIAAKLRRSPLAAKTVAAQLRKRQKRDFWLSMLNQNLLNETMGALLLSYQHLPPPLQRCFAICSLFPKGLEFDHDYLVSLWIAEGFIETEGSNDHVRDIGNGYILELISSSFLQVSERSHSAYCLHDLLHDIAEKVSEGECFRIEDGEKGEIPTQTHHLFVKGNMFKEYVRKICKLKYLRTIIIDESRSELRLQKEDLNALFKESRKLYVVDLHGFIQELPKSVIYLENLRYLNYGYGYAHGKDILKSLTRLYQLRILYNGMYLDFPIPDIGRLTLLQQLYNFKVGNEREFGLEQLEHLRDLSGRLIINNLNNVISSEEARRAKLSAKRGVRALKLYWKYEATDAGRDRDADILDGLCPPHELEKLTINGYSGKRCPSWISEYNTNTTYLNILKLESCPFLEALPEINNLIHLQSLTIRDLPRLKRWAPLPSHLTDLTLVDCKSLAFVSEKDLKMIMSTRSREQSPFEKELEKLARGNAYHRYLGRQKVLDSICQLEEVNGELYLPLTLEKLKIQSCFITDKILANALRDHTSLTRLELWDIIPITCISKEVLSSLTNLRVLIICECLMLTSVGGFENLLSLQKLTIEDCPCLTIEMPIETPVVAKSNSLKDVTISFCMPPDDVFQALNFMKTSWVYNCPTIESPHFGHSKSLSSLHVENCVNLVSLRGLKELNNLQYLSMVGCHKLQCSFDAVKLPQVRELAISKLSMLQLISIEGLSSLVSLTLEDFTQEDFTPEDFTQEECEMLSHLSSLEKINFQFCKMQSLPNLLSLHSLKEFKIYDCHNLSSLSELPPSVENIDIKHCQNLTSLSELPPSIQRICIYRCNAEFTRSCKDASHPNWHKISHIPKKSISSTEF